MAEEQNPVVNQNYNFAQTGLNLDLAPTQLKNGMLTYALNASVENFDANSVTYQNEQGNTFTMSFPEGFVLIGKYFINEKNKHIFFITNPSIDENRDQIGYMENNDGVYRTIVQGNFGFSVHYPIHKCAHKITNCTTEIYWTDGLNARRWMDIEDPPMLLIGGDPTCNPVYSTTKVDVNRLKLQPNFSIPLLEIAEITNTGDIVAGTYQFAAQYCDALGNAYTSYYSVTNPVPIADTSQVTPNFNYRVGKSIVIDVSRLDTTGQFQYFNLAVIKTINGVSSVELAGTYFIDSSIKQIIYTGQNLENIRLTIADIFEKFPYYDIAQDLTSVQDVLVWDQLTSIDRINYQSIANQIQLKWETWRIPPGEDYSEENAANLRGYMRDEVYAFEIVFLLKNGKQTDGFHIPGREKGYNELNYPDIQDTDPDFIGEPANAHSSPYWMIYNTASVEGFSPEYVATSDYKGPYQYGEFAYWESTEEYPCETEVWGDLAGQKIRHHKFPDVLVSPIYEAKQFSIPENMVMGDVAIFPMGVKIDPKRIEELIQASSLTSEQKADIAGFKIIRGDRSTNKSVIAKGILRNVGRYERDDRTFYFPNYPYNDLSEDVFINGKNNAHADECLSWVINVYTLYCPPSGTPYARLSYTNCDTGKPDEIDFTHTKDNYICSIGRPVLTAGTGIIGTSSYEKYVVTTGNQGCRIAFYDRFHGYRERWCHGGGGSFTLETEPDSGGVAQIEGPGHATITFLGTYNDYTLYTCSDPDKGLPSIRSDKTLAYRQVFNSPDTSFGKPFLGNILKLENVMFGAGVGHFSEVKDCAKYKLLSKEAQEDALFASEVLAGSASPFDQATMMSAYQSYLQIYINGLQRKNFAYSYNSIADYNYSSIVPNGEGIKQRNLDIKKYLVPSVVSTTDDQPLNNWQRETSVYLRTVGSDDSSVPPIPFPDKVPDMLSGGTPKVSDQSRTTLSLSNRCNFPLREDSISVVSYYASIKNQFVNQWGQIYSYQPIDTGYQHMFGSLNCYESETIFGGDTFINRFGFKTKLPFFIDNRVKAPDDSDIFYDEIGNIGFPKYWHSARSVNKNWWVKGNAGEHTGIKYPPEDGFSMTNIISYKAHYFDCPNSQLTEEGKTHYDGYYYLFAYGIPYFYCESTVNVDLRQAFNSKEGDFYPHVTNHIPDDWVQENHVPIAQDNTYYYNTTFSKQNKENSFTHLPPDWEAKLCFTHYPFRGIYSDSQNTDSDNRINAWLNYRALSYFDFPQNYGKLVSLDGIQNKAVLARFENKSLLYDNLLTIDTSNPQAAYVGNPYMFKKSPPVDFAETDLGYIGSQHKMLLKIPQGQITVDAKRGQVFLLTGTTAIDLAAFGSGLNRFFTDHLAFEILRYFPEVDVDNHYNGIGLHGTYDSKFDRFILTKIDYIPIDDRVQYDPETKEFYIENEITIRVCDCALFGIGTFGEGCFQTTTSTTTHIEGDDEGGEEERGPVTTTTTTTTIYTEPCPEITTIQRVVISLTDPDYFCNKSWTLSYNMNTKSWVSFHSYIPNWYIAENNFFYSGINGCCEDFDFVAAVMVTTTSTTSTTTTSTTSTTTTLYPPTTTTATTAEPTTTTTTTTATPTTTTTTTTVYQCQRPLGLNDYSLFTGYEIVSPPVTFDSTGSRGAACSAEEFINNHIGDSNVEWVIEDAQGIGFEIVLGTTLFLGTGTDCTLVPDGWYFTEDMMYVGRVLQVTGGAVAQILSCEPTTTTTTSSTTTTTTTTTMIPISCSDTIDYDSLSTFETIYDVDLGTDTGYSTLAFGSDGLPVRIIVWWDGSIVIDTGYFGAVEYDYGEANRGAFDYWLLGKVDPVTSNPYPDYVTYPDDGYPRVLITDGTAEFEKTGASPENAELHLYAPFTDSTGKFKLWCVGEYTTTTTTTTETPTTTTTTTIPPP